MYYFVLSAEYRQAACLADGPGALQEQIARIRHLWEVNGWEFLQVLSSMNEGPRLLFRKPHNAPDITPFFDPNAIYT
jgi:hypothetical protein